MTTFLVDLLALAAMALGAVMMFRQRLVRQLWTRVGGAAKSEIAAPEKQEAARYALTIFGMMLFAFGLILFAFFTAFALAR